MFVNTIRSASVAVFVTVRPLVVALYATFTVAVFASVLSFVTPSTVPLSVTV